VDDDTSPATPATTVAPGGSDNDVLSGRIARENQRDNARGGTTDDVLSERVARELQRDAARAGTFAD